MFPSLIFLRMKVVKPHFEVHKALHKVKESSKKALICCHSVPLCCLLPVWMTTLHKRQSILINNLSKARAPGGTSLGAKYKSDGNNISLSNAFECLTINS